MDPRRDRLEGTRPHGVAVGPEIDSIAPRPSAAPATIAARAESTDGRDASTRDAATGAAAAIRSPAGDGESRGRPRPGRPRPSRPGVRRVDLGAALLCALVGVGLSALPHLTRWRELGGPVWIADDDEMFYLAVGAQAYHNHPFTLADPVRSDARRCIYRWLPLMPGLLAAKALDAGPLAISLGWRVWGGLTFGLGLYFFLRVVLARPGPAAAATLVLLADTGLTEGRPLLRQARILVDLARGRAGGLFAAKPLIFPHWRVATPALTMAYLCLHLGLVLRARARPTWPRLVAAGVGFGLLFHVYFYYWTAAGLALLLALAVDAGHRRVYFHTGWIGGLVGLPAIVGDLAMKRSTASDWLLRTDKFLPIPRLSELLVPAGSIGLFAVALVLVWRRRRDLTYPALFVAAGLLLSNHQVVSGLQIENFHYVYAWGAGLSLLLAGLAAGAAQARGASGRPATVALVAGCVAYAALGGWLRWQEAVRSRESRSLLDDYARYRGQRLGPDAPPLVPNAVVAGDRRFVDFASILENQRPLDNYAVVLSPAVLDPEWDERVALNGYLSGRGRDAFREAQRTLVEGMSWGPWARDPDLSRRKYEGRLAAFDAVAADPSAFVGRYAVRYVALSPGAPSPTTTTAGRWERLQSGPSWELRRLASPATPRADRRPGNVGMAASAGVQ